MAVLKDFNVKHNLPSDAEAESTLRELLAVVDSQPAIDQILADGENWGQVAKYKTHSLEAFLDLEKVDSDYNMFIEGDITGMPDSVSLMQEGSGYALTISHRGKNERVGDKRFVFDSSMNLVERVERFERGVMPGGISGNSVALKIEGSRIVSADSYNSDTGKVAIEKSNEFSRRRVENAFLMKSGWLVPSEAFRDYCRSKVGAEVSEGDIVGIAEVEGLDEGDIDFMKSKAYIRSEVLYITRATKPDWVSIIDSVNAFTNLAILDHELLGFKKPKLRTRIRRRFSRTPITKEYPLEQDPVRSSGGSAVGATSGGLMEGSIHTIIHSDKTFDDIGGQDAARDLAYSLVNEMKERKDLVRLGLKDFSFVIGMYGPPGSGKTLLAEIIAHESSRNGRCLLAVAAGSLNEQLVGVGSGRIRSMFNHARQVNGIVFIDEIDSVGLPRTSSLNSESGNTLNTLLTEIEGVKGKGVDVIWATNVPFDKLDSALLSRTSYKISMDDPDYNGRKCIFEIHSRGKRLSYSGFAALDYYAKLLEGGGSGRAIKNMLNQSLKIAKKSGERKVSPDSLQKAFELTFFGMDGSSARELQNKVMEYTAFHEAGHAVVAYHLLEKGAGLANYVNMVSIKPMGVAAGFVYTRSPDKYSEEFTKRHYIDHLAVALAGHVSESINFAGEVTPGALNDFDKVREITKNMVLSGMDGKVHMDDKAQSFLAARDALVREAYNRCESVLKMYGDLVFRFAHALMDEKVVYRDRIVELMEKP